jgi:plastocyanin
VGALASSERERVRCAGRALFAALALLGASCGAAAQPKTHTIVIEAMQFSPLLAQVNVGDTVVWKNKDFFPHTASAEAGSFDSGEIAPSRSWKFKARKKGVFPYVCRLHPTMKGSLQVK